MSIKTRICKTSNELVITALDLEIFPNDEPLDLDGQLMWVMRSQGYACGFCCMKVLPNDPTTAFFSRAGVVLDFRGYGLHSRLIKKRIDYAKKIGLENIITYVKRNNAPSANSLIKHKFKLYEPEFEWADEECIYFILQLA